MKHDASFVSWNCHEWCTLTAYSIRAASVLNGYTCCVLWLMLPQLSPEEYQKLPVGHLVLLKLASEPAGVRVVGVTDRLSGTIRVRHLYTGVLVPEADIMSLSAGYPRYNDTQDSWWTMRAAPEQVGCSRRQQLPLTVLQSTCITLVACVTCGLLWLSQEGAPITGVVDPRCWCTLANIQAPSPPLAAAELLLTQSIACCMSCLCRCKLPSMPPGTTIRAATHAGPSATLSLPHQRWPRHSVCAAAGGRG